MPEYFALETRKDKENCANLSQGSVALCFDIAYLNNELMDGDGDPDAVFTSRDKGDSLFIGRCRWTRLCCCVMELD